MATSKIALVTGGSRGLGKNMALSLATKGIDILLTYHSNQAEADATVAEIAAQGRKAAALQLNAGDPKTFAAFYDQVRATLQTAFQADGFDFLINNAGTGGYALIADTTEELFDELNQIHFKGVFFLTQRALPLLREDGRIINVSSGLTRYSAPGYAAYAAAKGAVEVFTHYLAKELGERRIGANVVAPGGIATEFGGGGMLDPNVQANISSQIALGRVGQPADIGGVVAFLCTPEAAWINGQRIEVTGGYSI